LDKNFFDESSAESWQMKRKKKGSVGRDLHSKWFCSKELKLWEVLYCRVERIACVKFELMEEN